MVEACVLITVYNGAPWIDEALDSALEQRGIEVEVLVVDDGSTDATPEILARRAARDPERIRVVTIPQSGLSRARNIGFDHVRAEFVTCLDADDRMHPLRVKLECDALRAHPDAMVSFAGRWNFDDGSDLGTYGFTARSFGVREGQIFTKFDDPLSAMLEAGEYPGTDACTCRTQWAREHGRFDPAYRTFVDGERWLRCLRSTPVVYVAAPLYQRRVHGGAMSADFSAISHAVFSAIDAARADWNGFTARQRRNIDAFERRAGVWLGRRAGLAGDRTNGMRFLWANRQRLHSAFWWRTMGFLLTPAVVHRTWRSLRPKAAPAPRVPLSVVTVEDPTTIWSRSERTHTPATVE